MISRWGSKPMMRGGFTVTTKSIVQLTMARPPTRLHRSPTTALVRIPKQELRLDLTTSARFTSGVSLNPYFSPARPSFQFSSLEDCRQLKGGSLNFICDKGVPGRRRLQEIRSRRKVVEENLQRSHKGPSGGDKMHPHACGLEGGLADPRGPIG